MLVNVWKNQDAQTWFIGLWSGTVTWEKILAGPMTQIIPLLDIYPGEMKIYVHRKTKIRMFWGLPWRSSG